MSQFYCRTNLHRYQKQASYYSDTARMQFFFHIPEDDSEIESKYCVLQDKRFVVAQIFRALKLYKHYIAMCGRAPCFLNTYLIIGN